MRYKQASGIPTDLETILINALDLMKNNKDISQTFPEEKHAIIKTEKGYERANFLGPHTQLDKRRGKKEFWEPKSKLDSAAKIHDLQFEKINKSNLSKEEKMKQIHDADQEFIDRVSDLGLDGYLSGKIIYFKKLLEKTGILDPSVYSINKDGKGFLRPNYYLEMERKGKKIDIKQGGFVNVLVPIVASLLPYAIDKIYNYFSNKKSGSGITKEDKIQFIIKNLDPSDIDKTITTLTNIITK